MTVVYTAETQSLAVLEVLVHLDSPELLQKYLLISVEIDESLVSESQLPPIGAQILPQGSQGPSETDGSWPAHQQCCEYPAL